MVARLQGVWGEQVAVLTNWTNWILRGFCLLWQLPVSDLLLKIGERCWNVIIHPVFAFVLAIYSNWTPQSTVQSAIFVSFRATRHDRTPVLLLAGDRQRFAMPRNLAHCVHLFLNTLLQALHYDIEMSMFLPRDFVRWKKRANFLWDKSIGAIVLPQAR